MQGRVVFPATVEGGEGEGESEGERGAAETVSREVFCKWLEVSEVRWGSAMAEWWCRQEVGCEGVVEEGGKKASDDDTVVDLYRQIVAGVAGAHLKVKEKAKELKYYEVAAALDSEEDRAGVRETFLGLLTPLEREAELSGGRVTVGALVEWGRKAGAAGGRRG